MKPPWLLCTDLDGTLLSDDETLSAVVESTLRNSRRTNARLALATGRPARDVMPWALDLQIFDYVACSNGASIFVGMSGAVMFGEAFDAHQVARLIAQLRSMVEHQLHIGLDTPYGVVLDRGFSRRVPHPWTGVGIVADVRRALTPETRVTKVLVTPAAPFPIKHVEAWAKAGVGAAAEITHSTPHFIEMTPRGANKGNALHWIATDASVPAVRTAAVGDMPNDIPILRRAELGAAVANAHIDLKAVANFHAPSNNEDGVAAVVHHVESSW